MLTALTPFKNFSPFSYIGGVAGAGLSPQALNVAIAGTQMVGSTVTGSYTYFSPVPTPESGTTFQWSRANDAAGTGSVAIVGATSITYTLVVADDGKYLQLSVTPRDGTLTGSTASSAWRGPTGNLFLRSQGSKGGETGPTNLRLRSQESK